MDVRVLRYFLTVAREASFSRAADALYMSQPTLSRQIRDLEEELGTTLFVRTNRNVTLTRDGMRLRRRAQEIVELMDRTREEFENLDEDISGDVCIGSGETHAMRALARVAIDVRREHPGVRYHLFSGNADDVTERLDRGLLDFGVVIDPADLHKYDFLRIPGSDSWGLLMPADHPLAAKEAVTPGDLDGVPLLVSRQSMVAGDLARWLGGDFDRLEIAATYNLVFNAAIMVEQGMGCALTLDHLVGSMDVGGLCFRPLAPKVESGLNLVWKKYQVFSPAAEAFLRGVREAFEA
ncbi:MAG TPA: LysR family transcriptional regulator [Candidatus Faecivicinus avistercoris]|nr:LysR family transcriptional regulator [Candidatus Faecivicinus avistercoris]